MKNSLNTVSIITIICLSIVAFLIFHKYQSIKSVKTKAIEAIPTNAAIIIESDNWALTMNDLEKSTIFNTITNSPSWETCKHFINKVKMTLMANPTLNSLVDGKEAYLSIHHTTNNFNYQISTGCSEAELNVILSNDSLVQNYTTRQYDGITIYQISEHTKLCHHSDILFLSNSDLLIEEGIRQLNNKISLLDNPAFVKVEQTKSTFSVGHIYVNFDSFSKFISENTRFDYQDIQWLSRWANWAELDLEITNDDFTLSGFTLVEDSSSNYLTSLFAQGEQKIEISKIAPKNTNKIIAFGVDDPFLFHTNYKEFLAKHNNLYEHNKSIKEINSSYQVDIENTINSIVQNEMGVINTMSNSGKAASYIFFKSKDESIEILEFLSKSISGDSLFIEQYRGFTLSQIDIPFLFKKMYGYFFKAVKNNYYTWIDNYLIVSDTPANLKAFINYYLSEKTLNNHPNFLTFSDKIATRCNFFYYSNPSSGNWNSVIKSSLDSILLLENWTNINGFVYQLSSKDDLFYNNVVLHYESNSQQDSQLEWIVDLDEIIISEPQIVFNHQSKTHNVIIQDAKKSIILINEKGKVIWTKPIGGKVLDKIHQIDYYKNRKLQYIFNTEDSLYIIDRLGRNVENFPVSLIAKASRGLSVLDYDKNRKYRFMIPSNDGYLYNYNKVGELVNGWSFQALENSLSQQVKYASVSSKDYIYVCDKKGNMSIVGRNGKKRTKINNIPISGDFYVDNTNGNIYSTDSLANVWLTQLNGTSTKIKTSDLENHMFYVFPFTSDEIMNLFISDDKSVKCYNSENKVMTFKVVATSLPKAIHFNNESYLAISNGEYCHLFKSDGSLASSSPFFGGGEFNCVDLDMDNKLNLLVINNNTLYNYAID